MKCENGKCDNDMKIALTIYHYTEIEGEKVWYNKLKDIYSSLDKKTVTRSLRILSELGFIKGVYGESPNKRPAKLYSPTGEAKALLESYYKKYYKEIKT
ncbi:MAG TPA: hypothetical protein PK718_04520 [Candidatus Methanofastidiosa archaeon]|nr:hypothetical protein [Candidatus Methanofastidiosa archaeon]